MFGREGAALRSVMIVGGLALVAVGLAAVAARVSLPNLLRPDDGVATNDVQPPAPDALAEGGDSPSSFDGAPQPLSPGDGSLGPADGAPDGASTQPPHRPTRQGKRDIERVGPGRYVIQRSAIDDALAEGATKGGTGAVRVTENGQPIGYRLINVSPRLRQVGLRNGDIVMSVNGRKMTSPDAALAAYGGMRKTTRANVRLRRGGRPVTLSYTIQGSSTSR